MNTAHQERITVIDALRGFTLLGILIVHTQQLWGLHIPVPDANLASKVVNIFIDAFMVGKFYKVFNMLFGVSFFIILSRAETKGIDFRARFVWRLVLLIFIGYLHEFIYTWEALLGYGLIGIPLVFFYKLNKKKVLIIAIACLAINPFYEPFFEIVYQHLSNPKSEEIIQVMDNDCLGIEKNQSVGSFLCAHFDDNMKHSTVKRLKYLMEHGPFTTFGLFLIGLFLAKIRFFENTEQKKTLYKKVFYISTFVFCMFYGIQKLFLSSDAILSGILNSYGSDFFAAILVSGFILLYTTRIRSLLDYLIPYGKMGLTNYIAQSVFGLIFFTQAILGFNDQGIIVRTLIAVLFFVFQTFVCAYWLRYFAYGPIEWIWRCGTYLKCIPFRKKK